MLEEGNGCRVRYSGGIFRNQFGVHSMQKYVNIKKGKMLELNEMSSGLGFEI